jgi:hypothetical protein
VAPRAASAAGADLDAGGVRADDLEAARGVQRAAEVARPDVEGEAARRAGLR